MRYARIPCVNRDSTLYLLIATSYKSLYLTRKHYFSPMLRHSASKAKQGAITLSPLGVPRLNLPVHNLPVNSAIGTKVVCI